MLTITLGGKDEEFVRAEAARLGWSPAYVVEYMIQMQILARERAGTPEGQEALRAAARALRPGLRPRPYDG